MNSALDYHQSVGYDRFDMKGGLMDWSNQPSVFKEYPDIPLIPLPTGISQPSRSFGQVLQGPESKQGEPLTAGELWAALSLGYGLTARAVYGSGYFYYRSAPSAGALYPVEIYVATDGLGDLDDGLYHYPVSQTGLKRLRQGSYDGYIARVILEERRPSYAYATFFFTAVRFRSSWKYRDRAYRYHLLDTGHALENIMLALKLLGRAPRLELDFADDAAADFLGVNRTEETPLALVRLRGSEPPEGQGQYREPERLSLRTERLAPRVEHSTAIETVDGLCAHVMRPLSAGTGEEPFLGKSASRWIELDNGSEQEALIDADFVETVLTRRSKRNYVNRAMDSARLAKLVAAMAAPDNENPLSQAKSAFSIGVILANVEGVENGFYAVEPENRRLGLIKSGDFRSTMAHVCLDQMWLANSTALFVFLADFKVLEGCFGPRGYRYAMIEAGRLGQRLYLAANALNLGCCGIGAFYDNEAMQSLDLRDSQRMLYLVSAGIIKK